MALGDVEEWDEQKLKKNKRKKRRVVATSTFHEF